MPERIKNEEPHLKDKKLRKIMSKKPLKLGSKDRVKVRFERKNTDKTLIGE